MTTAFRGGRRIGSTIAISKSYFNYTFVIKSWGCYRLRPVRKIGIVLFCVKNHPEMRQQWVFTITYFLTSFIISTNSIPKKIGVIFKPVHSLENCKYEERNARSG